MDDNDAASVHTETSTVEAHPAYPFIDEDGDADVVLRSSDVVDFYAHRLIMSKASPFFKTMFMLPQDKKASSDQEMVNGKPVLSCSEDSNTLRLLLLFIYPVEDPPLYSLNEVSGVLEAAVKYDVDFIAAKVRHTWNEMVRTDPLRAYAIACLKEWPKEALAAAKSALKDDIWPLEPPLCEEYDLVSANTVLRLEQYHRACATKARNLALHNRDQWAHVLNNEQCEHCNQKREKEQNSIKTKIQGSEESLKFF